VGALRALLVTLALLAATAPACAHRLGRHLTVSSTAYSPCSSGSMMANGRHVRWGAVANNMLPLGTRIRLDRPISAHRPDGRLVHRRWFTVADRIGWGTELDVWMPSCADAVAYGSRTVGFRVAVS